MDAKTFFVAGVQHHDLHKVINDLEEGEILELEPEPTNKYDPNAVRILSGTVMIGYVPKKFSAEIAAMLENEPLLCTVTKLDKRAKPWEMCEVTIEEPDIDEFNEGDEEVDNDLCGEGSE